MVRSRLSPLCGLLLPLFLASSLTAEIPGSTWRYHRPGNTGIQGDFNDALWLGPDGDPWISGYDPGFEEGGLAKLVVAENRWVNVSNIDFPLIGHPDLTGTTRITDIVADAQGRLWMSTWRSVLRMNPAVGGPSIVNFASAHPALPNGGARDIDIAPDGTIWFALLGYFNSLGGVVRHNPADGSWHYWTGGVAPQGGGGWPQLVWTVAKIAVQPKPGGGYVVWADSDNTTALVSWDSATQTWTNHDLTMTPGDVVELPGKDSVDDAGNLWMRRFAGFSGSTPLYSLDYRTPAGDWVTPPQPLLAPPGDAIDAFSAVGDHEALLVDGGGKVWQFRNNAWQDLGTWREGSFSSDVEIDTQGNVWVSGPGGAASRDAVTGSWQRYRVSNTSQYDSFNTDLAIDPETGDVYACANAAPGIGGMTKFDGRQWSGFNNLHYGLGVDWPFPTDNCQQVAYRPSFSAVVPNPTYDGHHQWDGLAWSDLGGSSESRGLEEDSLGRLWSLGPYFELAFLGEAGWTSAPNNGTWGNNLVRDPSRPGTVWVSTYAEVIRTDGTYRYARTYDQFPELDTQSDTFTTVAAGPNGVAWLGSTQGVFRLDAEAGTYQFFASLGSVPMAGARPLAVSPDGKLWLAVFDPNGTGPHGLVWFDGTTAGIYPAPRGGEPQWGGLPHAQIRTIEIREVPGGYELWMICASRGIAVLRVPWWSPVFSDGFESGDLSAWSLVVP